MNKIKLITIGLLATFFACNDSYDKHFDTDGSGNSAAPQYSIMELIEQQSDLSVFAEILKKQSIDKVLSSESSQTYTVWAPTNAALAGVNVDSEEERQNVINMHVARFAHSASGNLNEIVTTLEAKQIRFEGSGEVFTYGGKALIQKNHVANNGILHVLSELVPFVPNLWEYLKSADVSLVSDAFHKFDMKLFQSSRSPLIDYIDGLPVYDSVFVSTNEMWYRIGYLNNEDSAYTMILPTNTAWEEAYNRVSPYFVNDAIENSDSLQRNNTEYAMVKDLIFRNLGDPLSYSETDSVYSTFRNFSMYSVSPAIYDPAHLFAGAQRLDASNGVVYKTNQLKYKAGESWQQPIQIEAEWSTDRTYDESTISNVHSYWDYNDLAISNKGYLVVEPRTATSKPTVYFPLPNVLAGAYNIYCVFLPATYKTFNTKNERTIVRYEVQMVDRTTLKQPVSEQVWKTISSGGGTGTAIIPADNYTDSTEIKKMLVAENFVFPYANYNEQYNTYRLKVYPQITTQQSRQGFNNRMLIDYILLEPRKD